MFILNTGYSFIDEQVDLVQSEEVANDELGDACRFLFTFDFDNDLHDKLDAFAGQGFCSLQDRMPTNAFANQQGGWVANSIASIVHTHAGICFDRFMEKASSGKAQGIKAMSDASSKWTLASPLWLRVKPLIVTSQSPKCIDRRLIHFTPLTDAQCLANLLQRLINAGDDVFAWHECVSANQTL
jgi:hypothetical protein